MLILALILTQKEENGSKLRGLAEVIESPTENGNYKYWLYQSAFSKVDVVEKHGNCGFQNIDT